MAAKQTKLKKSKAKGSAQKKTEKKKKTSPHESLKLQVAHDLGLWEKVKQVGWGGLSAAESGRVGGIMTRILRQQQAKVKAK